MIFLFVRSIIHPTRILSRMFCCREKNLTHRFISVSKDSVDEILQFPHDIPTSDETMWHYEDYGLERCKTYFDHSGFVNNEGEQNQGERLFAMITGRPLEDVKGGIFMRVVKYEINDIDDHEFCYVDHHTDNCDETLIIYIDQDPTLTSTSWIDCRSRNVDTNIKIGRSIGDVFSKSYWLGLGRIPETIHFNRESTMYNCLLTTGDPMHAVTGIGHGKRSIIVIHYGECPKHYE